MNANRYGRNTMICAALAMSAVLAGGCEKKGPVEQAGEEIDEALDTVRDGKESTATKLDDAVDELQE